MKKDVCGSYKQCTRPTDSAISNQCADIQSDSGSCAPLAGLCPKWNQILVKKIKIKISENSKHRHETSESKHSLYILFLFTLVLWRN